MNSTRKARPIFLLIGVAVEMTAVSANEQGLDMNIKRIGLLS
jgi:hypothetical protein